MNVLSVGRWILLGAGVFAVGGAVVFTHKHPSARRPLWMWVFGVLLAGVGVFGPEFMPKYGGLLGTITDMVKNPGAESYEKFFASVGVEKMPAELREVGINYAVSHPIKEMESVLSKAIAKAPADTEGRAALEWAKESYTGRLAEIDLVVKTAGDTDTVKVLSPVTRDLVLKRARELPEDKRRELKIDASVLRRLEATRRPFPGKAR